MIYTIQNEFLTVRVEDLGAQLSSIQAPDGTEYLWQGDPDIWARRAPILFPFIARLRENTYYLDGQPYAISTHGFARDMVFSLVEQGEDHISLLLTDTPETREVYPFSFSLTVTYTLEKNRLKKSHRVENRSQRDMYYELGAHDGFRAPVEPGVPMSSWSIRLPGVEPSPPPPMGWTPWCWTARLGRWPSWWTTGATRGCRWSSPTSTIWGCGRRINLSTRGMCASSLGPPSPTQLLWGGSCPKRLGCAAWPPARARSCPISPPSTTVRRRKRDEAGIREYLRPAQSGQ